VELHFPTREMRAALTAALLLVAVPAWAQPCRTAQGISAGQPAPCGGLLVPQADAVQALRCLRVDLPGCRADVIRHQTMLEASAAQVRRERQLCDDTLEQCERTARRAAGISRPLAEHPAVWLVFGLAAGAAGAYAVMRIRASE